MNTGCGSEANDAAFIMFTVLMAVGVVGTPIICIVGDFLDARKRRMSDRDKPIIVFRNPRSE